jgi:hypothetical protein
MNRGAHSGVSEHSSITERWSGQLSDAPAYLSAQQTTGNEKPNLKKHQIRLTAFYVPLPVLVGCIAAPTDYSADVSVSPPVSDSLHPGANCRDPSENRLGCYVICPELFGTVTLIPFLLEAAVRRREPENSSENWINDARRRLADWRGKKPETKAGQIWALWPEIKAALSDGQSIKSIRGWLEEGAGIVVTADSLRSYVRRCYAKEEAGRRTAGQHLKESTSPKPPLSPLRPGVLSRTSSEATPETDTTGDPMAIARKALNKSRFDIRKIHGDGDPSGRKLI